MAKVKKILLAIAAGALFLGLILLVTGLFFAWRAVPNYNGEIKLTQKLDSPVKITFDRHGIPHIEAENSRDFYFSFGYLMASERLFQMDIHRRLSSGRLSELFGMSLLELDQYYANFALYEIGEKLLENLPPELASNLDTFYEGVNHFIEEGPRPFEYYVLASKPLPFSKKDGMSFIGHMALSFSLGMRQDPLFSKLKQLLPEELYRELLTNAPRRLMAGHFVDDLKVSALAKNHLDSLLNFGFFEGSNGWVLNGNRTTSGAALLASDPHISFASPGIWYEAHYKIKSENHEMYGHFMPLLPIPVLGHNRQFGWGLTMSYTDDLDLYKEQIDFTKEQYLENGEWKNLESWERDFHVRGSRVHTKRYFKTSRGPVFTGLLNEGDLEVPLSLRWSHYREDNQSINAFWKMNQASNLKEFQEAIGLARAPGLNVLYADREGNIAQFLFGDVWLRGSDNPSYEVLDSANPDHFPRVALPINLRPNIINPQDGQIVSANQRPILASDEIHGDWHADDRYRTIEEALFTKDKWSPKETQELQTANRNIKLKFIVNKIKELLAAQSGTSYKLIFEQINGWDGHSTTDSIAPTFIYSWIENLGRKVLMTRFSEKDYDDYFWLNAYWIFIDRIVKDSANPWWKDLGGYDEALKLVTTETMDGLNKKLGKDILTWKWGKLHTLTFNHPLGNIPGLSFIFNLGPYQVPGAFNDVNNMRQVGSNQNGEFIVRAGPSTRRIIDFSAPDKAHGILPIGNSGHIFSPFYRDQLPLFIKGEYRPMLLNFDEIREHWFYSELTFTP